MDITSVVHKHFLIMTFNVELSPSTRRNRKISCAIQYRPVMGLVFLLVGWLF